MAQLPPVTDATFEKEVLQSGTPVLVDFSATWCGPCKQLAPILEGLAKDYSGKFKFVLCDIDQAPQTAMRFNVMSVPTMLIVKGGRIVSELKGVRSRGDIARVLDSTLESALGA